MQSGFAVGYALAAIVAAVIMPRWGWRPVFLVGILPAFLTLWIGRNVEESPLWLARRLGRPILDTGIRAIPKVEFPISNREIQTPPCDSLETRISNPDSPDLSGALQMVRPELRISDSQIRTTNSESLTPGSEARLASSASRSDYLKPIAVTLLMNSAALFGWWGLFTWIPAYLALPVARGGRGLSVIASSAWIIVMQVGMWLGYVTFGFISDAAGRKRTYVLFLFIAALLVPVYAQANPLALLAIGPLLAFFGTGHFTGFGIITAELFPTSFRATAMGLTYNFGRALSAAAPWAIGIIAARGGLAPAFGICGVAFLLAGVLALALPETRGCDLA